VLPVALDCFVTRTLVDSTQPVYRATAQLYDPNMLDRSHPYVSWVRASVVPAVTSEADGSLTTHGLTTIRRPSKIHRTDVPAGCLFVTPQGKSSGPPDYTYLDALPFPMTEISRNRHRLCDYCFYGGPTNTELLPLP
jgi:hypothetical protein